jgi:hypothetical protein
MKLAVILLAFGVICNSISLIFFTTKTPSDAIDIAVDRQDSIIRAARHLRSKGRTPEEAKQLICYVTACSPMDSTTIQLTMLGADKDLANVFKEYQK